MVDEEEFAQCPTRVSRESRPTPMANSSYLARAAPEPRDAAGGQSVADVSFKDIRLLPHLGLTSGLSMV